jgi:hypothetical protein
MPWGARRDHSQRQARVCVRPGESRQCTVCVHAAARPARRCCGPTAVSRLLGTDRGLQLSYGGGLRNRTTLLFLVPLGLGFLLLLVASQLTFRHSELPWFCLTKTLTIARPGPIEIWFPRACYASKTVAGRRGFKAVRPKAGTGEAVPVGALNEPARPRVDVLRVSDVERSAFAHSHSVNMHALTGTLRHIRPHHVTGLKTANTLGAHAVTARETVLVQPRPTVRAASDCLDCERAASRRASSPTQAASRAWLFGIPGAVDTQRLRFPSVRAPAYQNERAQRISLKPVPSDATGRPSRCPGGAEGLAQASPSHGNGYRTAVPCGEDRQAMPPKRPAAVRASLIRRPRRTCRRPRR